MKFLRFVLGVMLSLYAGFAAAQDILVLRNGEEMKVVVTEVTSTEVKYKKFSNQNGPVFTTPKSEIFMLKYQNGEKDVFSNTETAKSEKTSGAYLEKIQDPLLREEMKGHTLYPSKLSPSGIGLQPGYSPLSNDAAISIMGEGQYNEYMQHISRWKSGGSVLGAGVTCFAGGMTLMIVGVLADNRGMIPVIVLGGCAYVASFPLVPIGIVKKVTGKARAKKVLKQYNGLSFEEIEFDESSVPSLGLEMTSSGVGFSLRF